MRVMGIDPGYAIVGVGVVDYAANRFTVVEYEAVETMAHTPFEERLAAVYDGVLAALERTGPDALALERLFYTTNQKTVIQVAEARGVILLAAQRRGVPVFEYTPLQVKQSVAGYGKAQKKQVQEMTRVILGLPGIPRPDDVADALAMAICHAHSAGNRLYGLRQI